MIRIFGLVFLLQAQIVVAETTSLPAPPYDDVREKIFSDSAHLAECKSIKKDVGKKYLDEIPQIDGILNGIQTALSERDPALLQPFFHPRLRISITRIKSMIKNLNSSLGSPTEVSIFRLFAINSVDGHPQSLPCYGDKISVWPLTSYPLQLGVWLQVSGLSEVGRVYFSLVPEAEDKWFIGSFRFQPWTHAGRSHEEWIGEADALMASAASGKTAPEVRLAAWVKYDIAEKLIDGKHLFSHDMGKKIQLGKPMSAEEWQGALKSFFPNRKILHTASLLTVDGDGVLLRFELAKEISIDAMRKDCQDVRSKLKTTKWFSLVGGVRCSYVVKGEDPEKEGKLGGIYLGRNADVKNKD